MRNATTRSETIEDHALERVPAGQRAGWLELSWSTVGIVTTLIQLFVGAYVAFVAGIKLALIAGALVAASGALIGWGVGHIAYRSGMSSTLMSRLYGFGVKGSLVTSSIFAFMIIGFIAVENVLLYKGFLFYFGAEDTLAHRLIAYGALSLAWVLLTAYGFGAVTRVSSVLLIAFLAVLGWMMVKIIGQSGLSWSAITSYDSQFPLAALQALGATSDAGKLVFCINLLAGSAGALALIDADLGRYARSSADIGIAALLGNLALDVVMIFLGAVILYAGMSALVEYYMTTAGLSESQAMAVAIENPDRIAAAFIVFGGVTGTVLMVAAQAKAQVLNTYSSSLSLANLFDAVLAWRPGRLVFVILANVLSWLFLAGDILSWFNAFLVSLGVLTTAFAGIMMADYFIVRPRLGHQDTERYGAEAFNWAGLTTLIVAFVLAHYVLVAVMPIEIVSALLVSAAVYPLLRIAVFKPAPRGTGD
ncbi:MAG: cytosine permease [Gammaproteobacteria bacterium]|nr:cytosine permease [Gammaproteobacteria bacterium]